uniref:Uncharacterized protein n=1 Tax=Rhizophora mucronata TaxID=61149 RepID=A0A2P2PUC6_RHIMU
MESYGGTHHGYTQPHLKMDFLQWLYATTLKGRFFLLE